MLKIDKGATESKWNRINKATQCSNDTKFIWITSYNCGWMTKEAYHHHFRCCNAVKMRVFLFIGIHCPFWVHRVRQFSSFSNAVQSTALIFVQLRSVHTVFRCCRCVLRVFVCIFIFHALSFVGVWPFRHSRGKSLQSLSFDSLFISKTLIFSSFVFFCAKQRPHEQRRRKKLLISYRCKR